MFVRTKTTPNSSKTAVQLVENIREGNKVKQKIIRHFGYATNEEELKALKKLALRYKLELELENQPSIFSKEVLLEMIDQGIELKEKKKKEKEEMMVNLKDLREEKRICIGIHQTYGRIFKEIGYDKVIKNYQRRKKSVEMLFNIVMSRISNPSSKRSSVDMLEREYGLSMNLNSVYRMMDHINKKTIEKIKEISYNYVKGIFPEDINVIFYDCTTLYFESFIEDELKQNGYSKDGKFNQSQVLLALMVTNLGMPIGYELFEGGKFEGHTLRKAIRLLKNKYKIKNIIFVADSALLSGKNIKYLRRKKIKFIVGARIKNMSLSVKEKILDKNNYKKLDEKNEEDITYQEIYLKREKLRLIVTYSPSRAEKDKKDREKAIESLQKRLKNSNNIKRLLNNYGYKKFIQLEGESKISVNEEKLKEEEKWDGLHGIITDIDEKEEIGSVLSVISYYHDLWQVEETFRITKHDLEIRPIFHWLPHRIRAHVAICFMALVCTRIMEYRVRLQYKKMSPLAIRKALLQVEISILKDTKTGKYYAMPSKIIQDAKKIYQILGLKLTDVPYEIVN